MNELIKCIRDEWSTVKKAPLTLIIIFVLSFIFALQSSSWRYEGIVDLLKERIENKDDQLDDYRERVYEIKARGSKYSTMSLEVLKSETLKFAKNLRNFLKLQHIEMNSIIDLDNQTGSRINITALQQFGITINSEYNNKYKVDAILLRDELLSRLPAETQKGKEYLYEHPTNLIGMEIVTTDLERMAKLLK